MESKLNVKVKITDLKINKTGVKEVDALLPSLFTKQNVKLSITNINTAFSNSLRRIICCGTDVLCLHMDDLKTTDPFILSDNIATRLSLIPVVQSVDMNSKFELNVKNTTSNIKILYASDIKTTGGKSTSSLFEPLVEICTLGANCEMNIKISIEQGNKSAQHRVAFNTVSVPTDTEMYDEITQKGVKASLGSSAKNFEIRFNTNGNIEPITIIKNALNVFIKKCETAIENGKMSNNVNHYKYIIQYEDDTLANTLLYNLVNQLEFITYTKKIYEDFVTFNIRSTKDTKQVHDIINEGINNIIKTCKTILIAL